MNFKEMQKLAVMGLIQLGENYTGEEHSNTVRESLYEIIDMVMAHSESATIRKDPRWYRENVYTLPQCWESSSSNAKKAFYANLMTVSQVTDRVENFLFYFNYPDAELFKEFLDENGIKYEVQSKTPMEWVVGIKIKVDII